MSDLSNLQSTIDTAFDDRANVSPTTTGRVREAVNEALSLLDRGELRVAAAFADALARRFDIGKPYPRPFPEVSDVPARFKTEAAAALHLEAARGGIRAIAIEDALAAVGAKPES